ncbi:hypothetical protein WJX79_006023 [Trebouxia sp. C0005]
MEPWQVYDASTPELLSELSELSRIRSEDVRQVSRLARLSSLIEQELAERAPPTASCLSIHEQPDSNSFADQNSQAAAPSVLEAAIAAYKQEKRKLWKARKAGAQAGWGFAKTHSSWPKPDMKASSTLGPLRMAALSGSGSAADSHTNPGSCSESDSEGESQASAGASVEQNDWLPPQVLRWQDPTGRHDDLGLSFDYPSQQDSEGGPESSSHAIEQQATTGPDQKGTAAAAASFDQQVMPDRLSDWSMHSEDGFCSWPSTPLHDPLSRESSTRRVPMMNSKQASKGASKVQRVRKSWGSDDAIIRDRFTSTPQGERLMLAKSRLCTIRCLSDAHLYKLPPLSQGL